MEQSAAKAVPVDQATLEFIKLLHGKSIVVTGAGGSIASEICEQAIAHGASRLTLVCLTEGALYQLERRLRPIAARCELAFILGSVCDRRLMANAVAGSDVVVHAAAHKHVNICEQNPSTAVETNVGGTYIAARAAIQAGVSQFVFISTDKAVNPTSVMGATKRVAELMLRYCLVWDDTRYACVRFGNVMDSAGSVLPLWREQIAKGGPITITDPACERYFMTIADAVQLVLGTIAMRADSGTFVFDMGKRRRMIDIANELISASENKIEIKQTGLRPGEKLIEELHHGDNLDPTGYPRIYRVRQSRITNFLTTCDLEDLLSMARQRDHAAVRSMVMHLAGAP